MVKSGEVTLIVGTAGVVAVCADIRRYDRKLHFPDPHPEYEKQYERFLNLYQDLEERF
jgi:hypothetical protein